MSFHRKARRSLLAASLCFVAGTPVLADDAHHPPAASPPRPAASAPARSGVGQDMASPGMMGSGMMGHGMMQQGARPGMPMMSMMGMSEAGRLERINGHLAFVQAELQITEAQLPLWSKFATAVRNNAQAHNQALEAHQPGAPDPTARLKHQEHALAQRLDGIRAIRTALAPLYAALGSEQQKTFNELLTLRMMM
jgi:hypothetical protein